MNAATTEDDISRVVSTLYADALEPTICAMGCGGAGCNIVSLVHGNGIEGIRTIAMNVDREALEKTEAEMKRSRDYEKDEYWKGFKDGMNHVFNTFKEPESK